MEINLGIPANSIRNFRCVLNISNMAKLMIHNVRVTSIGKWKLCSEICR